MFKSLANLNIELNNNQQLIWDKYINLFLEYNKKVNLISKKDEKYIIEKHIYDSLAMKLFIDKYQISNKSKLLDIGTGGGFPSVPLSLLYNEMKIFALDSIKKKINFIEYILTELKIKNLKTICKRVEELPDNCKNSYDVVTSRAMAELRVILELAIPFVKKGGYFVAYKSLKAEEELFNAKNALEKLNIKLTDKIEYSLPLECETKRILLIFKKEEDTPFIYPRKNVIIKSKPL